MIDDLVAVRGSKRPEQAPLVYTRDEIGAMLAGAKASAFDHWPEFPSGRFEMRPETKDGGRPQR